MKKFLVIITICFVLAFSALGKWKRNHIIVKNYLIKLYQKEKLWWLVLGLNIVRSCASQMKVLEKAKSDFDNMVYFAFDVTNKEIAEFF
jgi:hypothetical protein